MQLGTPRTIAPFQHHRLVKLNARIPSDVAISAPSVVRGVTIASIALAGLLRSVCLLQPVMRIYRCFRLNLTQMLVQRLGRRILNERVWNERV